MDDDHDDPPPRKEDRRVSLLSDHPAAYNIESGYAIVYVQKSSQQQAAAAAAAAEARISIQPAQDEDGEEESL